VCDPQGGGHLAVDTVGAPVGEDAQGPLVDGQERVQVPDGHRAGHHEVCSGGKSPGERGHYGRLVEGGRRDQVGDHARRGVLGIHVAQQIFPETPQVAVFDTSFHQTLPEHAYLYAIPKSLYQDHGLRRYGFHGSSHAYVSETAAKQLGYPLNNSRVISAHLGNGCSATAILNGKSVDTTMGLTPLEGLVMGTRCGDIDPGLLLFLGDQLNMTTQEVSDLLNKQSGLLGISGISNDMRELRSSSEPTAALALEIFCYRAAKSLAALTVALGGLDTLIFTGGIGENDMHTRARILDHLNFLGLEVSTTKNEQHGSNTNGIITTDDSAATAVVIQTNEELMIATLTQSTLAN